MRRIKSILELTIMVILVLPIAVANAHWQPSDGHKMHFPQLPDEAGWDVYATQPLILADDWGCTESGFVKDIHFWGSWLNDNEGVISAFMIRIHSNIPQGPGGYSVPSDAILWERVVTNFEVYGPITGKSAEGWFDPYDSYYQHPNHLRYYQYNIFLEPEWFYQEQGAIYWLSISALVATPGTQWGWKTSLNHFMDDAVWGLEQQSPSSYYELLDPRTGDSLDLAFVITGDPNIPTQFPVYTECPIVDTHCPETVETECPIVETYCPETATVCQLTNCPANVTWCSAIDPTVCPNEITVCPQEFTRCPEIETVCPVQETICQMTMCPMIPTECGLAPTLCPYELTACPYQTTLCPLIPTRCPDSSPTVCKYTLCPEQQPTICTSIQTLCPTGLPTLCMMDPTYCQLTICPEEVTTCPLVETICSTRWTFCPELPTECPVIETRCPDDATFCSALDFTMCTPGDPTWCPVQQTICPQVDTLCPDGIPTLCQVTECPPADTLCPEAVTRCPVSIMDSEADGVFDCDDNCVTTDNGSSAGTCTKGTNRGKPCTIPGSNITECGTGGYCSMNQEDTRPPGGNYCGDACECESDLDRSGSVDGVDTNLFKADYGRNPFKHPCTNLDPCPGDFDCSQSVDGVDTNIYKEDYGRNKYKNPCPPCSGYTCVYP